MADLPHYHYPEWLGFQNQVACAPWGCAIPQEAWVMVHWVTLLRLQQKTWFWGCAAWEHPFPCFTDQPSLCHIAHKKSSGPSAPGATEHNPPPAPSQEEQKAFLLQPAAAEHTEDRDQYLSIIAVSFKCPQPCDYVSALLSWPAFHSRNSPHSPPKRAPELGSSEPVLIHNPK